MYSNKVRIILISICVLAAAFFGSLNWWLQTGAAIAVILLLVLGYFLNGAVFLAYRKLGKNDFEGAEKLLAMTKYPQHLGRVQKAYYYFIQGCLDANKKRLREAAKNFEASLQLGLRTQNDVAVALLNLASIQYQLGNRELAKGYLKKLEGVQYSQALQQEVEHLKKILNA